MNRENLANAAALAGLVSIAIACLVVLAAGTGAGAQTEQTSATSSTSSTTTTLGLGYTSSGDECSTFTECMDGAEEADIEVVVATLGNAKHTGRITHVGSDFVGVNEKGRGTVLVPFSAIRHVRTA